MGFILLFTRLQNELQSRVTQRDVSLISHFCATETSFDISEDGIISALHKSIHYQVSAGMRTHLNIGKPLLEQLPVVYECK